MKHEPIRGLMAVRAETDATIAAAIREQGTAFDAFKAAHQADLDDLSAKVASLTLNGFDGPSASAPRKVLASFQQQLAKGVPVVKAELQIGNSDDGGASVPKEILDMILNQAVDTSPLRGLARVERASTSDFHQVIGVRGASSGWAGETDPRSMTTTPKMGTVTPTWGECFAYVEATQWVLDDSQFNLEEWLRVNVADEMAIQENTAFFSGDGVDKPKGFLTQPITAADDDTRPFGTIQAVTAANAAVIEPDDLVNTMMALRTPYRAGGQTAWLMSRTTASMIRKLKDADGRFLWADSLASDAPAMLLGHPVYEAEDMPDVATGQIPIAFGNWPRGYLIADRVGMRLVRDPYTRPGWVRFYFNRRVGGHAADTNAIKLLQMA